MWENSTGPYLTWCLILISLSKLMGISNPFGYDAGVSKGIAIPFGYDPDVSKGISTASGYDASIP